MQAVEVMLVDSHIKVVINVARIEYYFEASGNTCVVSVGSGEGLHIMDSMDEFSRKITECKSI